MAARNAEPLNASARIVDEEGRPTKEFFAAFNDLLERTGGGGDLIGSTIESEGVLAFETQQLQGDANTRRLTQGTSNGYCRDGDNITFTRAWPSSNIPDITFGAGGLTFDSSATLTGDYGQQYQALNVTASGFTASLKLTETVGSPVNQVDGPGSEVITSIEWNLLKSIATEAVDDNYTVEFPASVFNSGSFPTFTPGRLEIGIYTDDGGGEIQRATVTLVGSPDAPITGYFGAQKTITVDGLGLNAEFILRVESGSGTLNGFTSVTYQTGSSPASISATPSGMSDIPYEAKGGTED